MNPQSTWVGSTLICLLALTARADTHKQLLTLTPAESTYLSKEPILITLRIEGETARNLPVALESASPSTALRFEIEPPVKPRKGANPLPAELAKAISQSRIYDLLEWFEFPESGEFTVQAVYENSGNPITSATIPLTIRAPKNGDANAEAVARIHHVPWSNYATNAYCGDTADVVKRWPESKLARYCMFWNGQYTQQQKDFTKAIAIYEELIAKYPNFILARDAKAEIEECRWAMK